MRISLREDVRLVGAEADEVTRLKILQIVFGRRIVVQVGLSEKHEESPDAFFWSFQDRTNGFVMRLILGCGRIFAEKLFEFSAGACIWIEVEHRHESMGCYSPYCHGACLILLVQLRAILIASGSQRIRASPVITPSFTSKLISGHDVVLKVLAYFRVVNDDRKAQ